MNNYFIALVCSVRNCGDDNCELIHFHDHPVTGDYEMRVNLNYYRPHEENGEFVIPCITEYPFVRIDPDMYELRYWSTGVMFIELPTQDWKRLLY